MRLSTTVDGDEQVWLYDNVAQWGGTVDGLPVRYTILHFRKGKMNRRIFECNVYTDAIAKYEEFVYKTLWYL